MSLVDSALTRSIMRDISKHPVDISKLDVHVSSGVVYLRGTLEAVRGYHVDVDLDEMLGTLVKCIRQRPDVRDVVVEITHKTANISARITSNKPRRF